MASVRFIPTVKLVSLIILAVPVMMRPAEIEVTVKSKHNRQTLDHAAVIVTGGGTKQITSPAGGRFVVAGITRGIYLVQSSALGYVTGRDTVVVTDSLKRYGLEVFLDEPSVESDSAKEIYHWRLQVENLLHPIMTMTIEQFALRNGTLVLFPSARNNTGTSFTIVRQFECIDYFSAVVHDSLGRTVRPNRVRTDCVGEKIYPTRDDLIRLPENRKVDCPPVTLERYNFALLPEGIYTVQLRYAFDKPRTLCCQNFSPEYRTHYAEVIDVLTTTLRGEYTSMNSITFDNKH